MPGWTPQTEEAFKTNALYMCCIPGCGAEIGKIKKKYCKECVASKERRELIYAEYVSLVPNALPMKQRPTIAVEVE